MREQQRSRKVTAIAPAAIIDNASATAAPIDTAGAEYAEIILQLGATDIAMTALKLQESDTSGGSYTDIPNANFSGGKDTDGNTLALPSGTDDGQVCVFEGTLLGRKRFLRVLATFGDGSAGGFIAGTARLSILGVVPSVDTDLASGGVCRF